MNIRGMTSTYLVESIIDHVLMKSLLHWWVDVEDAVSRTQMAVMQARPEVNVHLPNI